MMRVTIPAYLEVQRNVFKFATDCTYAEFVAALMRERDPVREAEMSRLLGPNLKTWRSFPQFTLGAMFTVE